MQFNINPAIYPRVGSKSQFSGLVIYVIRNKETLPISSLLINFNDKKDYFSENDIVFPEIIIFQQIAYR